MTSKVDHIYMHLLTKLKCSIYIEPNGLRSNIKVFTWNIYMTTQQPLKSRFLTGFPN